MSRDAKPFNKIEQRKILYDALTAVQTLCNGCNLWPFNWKRLIKCVTLCSKSILLLATIEQSNFLPIHTVSLIFLRLFLALATTRSRSIAFHLLRQSTGSGQKMQCHSTDTLSALDHRITKLPGVDCGAHNEPTSTTKTCQRFVSLHATRRQSTPLLGSATTNGALGITQMVQSFNVTTTTPQTRTTVVVVIGTVRASTVALGKGAITTGRRRCSSLHRLWVGNGGKEQCHHLKECCFCLFESAYMRLCV